MARRKEEQEPTGRGVGTPSATRQSWSIGELARRADLQTSAIRYYESARLLPEPRRYNGRRVYEASALEWLAVIRLAQGAGFSIAEIRELLHGFRSDTPASQRWRALAARKLEDMRRRIDEARAMEQVLGRLIQCECPTLQDCGRAVVGESASESEIPAR